MEMQATINLTPTQSTLAPLQSIHKTATIMILWKQTSEHITLLSKSTKAAHLRVRPLRSRPSHGFSDTISCHSLPCCHSNTGPQTHQAHACLQVFAVALPSVWNAPPADSSLAYSSFQVLKLSPPWGLPILSETVLPPTFLILPNFFLIFLLST